MATNTEQVYHAQQLTSDVETPGKKRKLPEGGSGSECDLTKLKAVLQGAVDVHLQSIMSQLAYLQVGQEEMKEEMAVLRSENASLKVEIRELKNCPPPPNTPMEVQNVHHEEDLIRAECRNERQEQYSRRESLRFFNIDERIPDTTNGIIKKCCSSAGIFINENDISVSHRVGKRGRKDRAIICKLTRRDKKHEILNMADNLKKSHYWFNVKIHEDLTIQRKILLTKLKEANLRFRTRDGRIEIQNGTQTTIIDDLYDLKSKLSWSLDQIKAVLRPANSSGNAQPTTY